MTKGQRITLMAEWWPNACQAQDWNPNDRDLRLRVLSEAVKRPLASANDLNTREDIDAVKAHLQMLADNIDAAHETDHPEVGAARRFRHIIEKDILPCLSLYIDAPQQYLQAIIAGLVSWNQNGRAPTLDDLSAQPTHSRKPPTYALQEGPSQLEQAMMTLNARLHHKRHAAGHTIHDMRIAAKLECNCARCAKARRTVIAPVLVSAEVDCPF
jgi:hypothetical protein